MKILILEDDEKKKQKLISFLYNLNENFCIEDRASYQSGLKALLSEDYDLILLDMTMPTFDISLEEDGWKPQPYAGRKILRQMKRNEVNAPVIVVTQFDVFGEGSKKKTLKEINKELHEDFSDIYKGTVYYNVAEEEWQVQLKSIIAELQS